MVNPRWRRPQVAHVVEAGWGFNPTPFDKSMAVLRFMHTQLKLLSFKSMLVCIKFFKKFFGLVVFMQCLAAHSQALDVTAYVWSLSVGNNFEIFKMLKMCKVKDLKKVHF